MDRARFAEALASVPWADLSHAYGSAADVPAQLLDLASPDPAVREEAFWQLYGNIFHQGTRYQATAYAAPFLLELLTEPAQPDRHQILQLLVHMAIGYQGWWLPAGIDPRCWDDEADEYAGWMRAAYQAFQAGTSMYVELLDDPDKAVRLSAGFALGWCREAAAELVPVVRRHLDASARRAPDPDEAANLAITLGLLCGYAGVEDDGRLAALTAPGRPRLTRACATIALINIRNEIEEPLLRGLLELLKNAPAAEEFLWLDGDLEGLITLAIGQLDGRAIDYLVPAACRLLPTLSATQTLTVAGVLLRRLFPAGLAAGRDFADLDRNQQQLLSVLAAYRNGWMVGDAHFGNFSLLLRDYGLPASQEAMGAFVSSAASRT